MPEKSVGFAIGNLRARENRLLKKNDLSGFAAASNVTELARMLRDKGIGKTDGADVPALLHEDAEEIPDGQRARYRRFCAVFMRKRFSQLQSGA